MLLQGAFFQQYFKQRRMQTVTLIADSGSTKAEWCVLKEGLPQSFFTTGISPYFLNAGQVAQLLTSELVPHLNGLHVDTIHYYGSGCGTQQNRDIILAALQQTFHIAG